MHDEQLGSSSPPPSTKKRKEKAKEEEYTCVRGACVRVSLTNFILGMPAMMEEG